jgi:hypothetical protein
MGGNAPMIGRHSVMDNPEPVSRVIPPNKTCTISITIPINSQAAKGRDDFFENSFFISPQS